MGRKVLIEVDELKDVELSFVSLVKRGANQSPFRVIKQEEAASDTTVASMVGKDDGEEDADSKIAAVFVNADVDDRIKPLLEKHGYDVSQCEERDGVVVYGQGVLEKGDPYGSLVSLGEGVGVALDRVQKEFLHWRSESTDFDKILSQVGYVGNLKSATDAFTEAALNNLDKASNGAEAATRIRSVATAFRKYVTAMTSALPDEAFLLMGDIAKTVEHGTITRKSQSAAEKEDEQVSKGTVSEAMPGDLEDLNTDVAKTETPKAEETPSIEASPDDKTADTPEVAKTVTKEIPVMVDGTLVKREATFQVAEDENGEEIHTMVGFTTEKMVKTQRVMIDGNPVNAEFEVAVVDGEEVFVRFVDESVQKAMSKGVPTPIKNPIETDESDGDSADGTLASALGELAEAVKDGNRQNAELLKTAIEKSNQPRAVLRNEDLDMSLASMGRGVDRVAKSGGGQADIWKDSALSGLGL